MTTENSQNQPIKKFRDRSICVSIWKNEHTDSETGEITIYYTVEHQRSYKQDDGWKKTTSVKGDYALKVSNLYRRAYDWVLDQSDK